MKKVLLSALCILCMASLAWGQSWNPTPLVIDSPDVVNYAFNGTNIDIPFTTTGKPSTVFLVVNTKLPDAQKPVAVTNGFKGWHFVNGIDTTVYVSAGRNYDVGTNKFPWDGHGNEKAMENTVDSGVVKPGTYQYALYAYDDKSSREVANNFIAIGFYSYPQVCLFYPYDDKTGALLPQPLLMGKQRHNNSANFNSTGGIFFKFKMGDDPYDQTKIETTLCPGFKKSEVVEGQTVNLTTPVYDPHDYNTFYFPKAKAWEFVSTVTKWTHVARGEAIQDMSWGDWNAVTWQQYGNYDDPAGVLRTDGDNLYYVVNGKNPVQYQTDAMWIFPFDDPTSSSFMVDGLLMDEFYQPAAPPDNNGIARTVAEFDRLDNGPEKGQFYASGDATCIVELINCQAMIDGATDPFKADGTGYVMWCNSNGDFFGDKNAQVEATNPKQLWSCHAYEPRNFNNQRHATSPADRMGFQVCHLDFAGLYSAFVMTQDGSGIAYMKYGDDSFSSGGDNTQKKGFGYNMDAGTIYDGIYVIKAMQASPAAQDNFYDQTNWIASDCDGGVISSNTAVEDETPASFTVSQNTPNPFNPTTTINFTLAKQGQVSVDVFNVAGQKVATLANDVMSAGSHSLTWDATGSSAGVYFYTVKSGDYSKTMKMTLLK